ncbi:MAG: hypothetical protein ACSHYC_00105 [Alphaproteobacteria bacterium]
MGWHRYSAAIGIKLQSQTVGFERQSQSEVIHRLIRESLEKLWYLKPPKVKKFLKTIKALRHHLQNEWISYNCSTEPCMGCMSHSAVELDCKLLALKGPVTD